MTTPEDNDTPVLTYYMGRPEEILREVKFLWRSDAHSLLIMIPEMGPDARIRGGRNTYHPTNGS